ncbi:hypothetical protein BDZ97DRAFT_737940, partial [Flammula alnicola]
MIVAFSPNHWGVMLFLMWVEAKPGNPRNEHEYVTDAGSATEKPHHAMRPPVRSQRFEKKVPGSWLEGVSKDNPNLNERKYSR